MSDIHHPDPNLSCNSGSILVQAPSVYSLSPSRPNPNLPPDFLSQCVTGEFWGGGVYICFNQGDLVPGEASPTWSETPHLGPRGILVSLCSFPRAGL